MDGAFPSEKGQGFSNSYGRGRGSGRGFRGTAENAKTKLCNRWMSGECTFGDRCNFAHGETQLRSISNDHRGEEMDRPYSRGGRGYDSRAGYNNRPYNNDMYQGGGYGGNQGYSNNNSSNKNSEGSKNYNSSHNSQTNSTSFAAEHESVPGPHGWFKYFDKDTKNYYYFNPSTSVNQWDRPKDWPEEN
mmetsp:Transcript_2479/g.3762  ORF Transcript_2479/g.3762 Transcript_2479/m.3762 type:complete len:188 (-) Transcript_2479:333-896(-)|eukprot:CAMPEP_0175055764 /NCGR_PEP_ID=MMETSP0052_2-20121109/10272_1 /TAXON_ID=51329 ORGANISM="Polytomella parva, Strain SAG 63-3" /NCGR_SAMPLE_ID=MMETSP0052_2 /ASSEMBLY_ACC=CAM_ASM_000194 /LENGTH=187 /DNA_ID=CAMNT_0016320667 /DNA_START=130 /DNA_END=693 /DNA_ORIENTATION=-